jgi:hypothetical protein
MRALVSAAPIIAASLAFMTLFASSGRTKSPLLPLQVTQQLTVVFMKYEPGNQPLQIEDRFDSLSPEDMTLLRKYVPTGTARGCGRGIYENGPKAKAILLLTGPFQRQVTVKQPWHSTVLYLQKGQTLTVLSKDAELLDRNIYLEQQANTPRYTTYMIDLADGARQGGSGCIW